MRPRSMVNTTETRVDEGDAVGLAAILWMDSDWSFVQKWVFNTNREKTCMVYIMRWDLRGIFSSFSFWLAKVLKGFTHHTGLQVIMKRLIGCTEISKALYCRLPVPPWKLKGFHNIWFKFYFFFVCIKYNIILYIGRFTMIFFSNMCVCDCVW